MPRVSLKRKILTEWCEREVAKARRSQTATIVKGLEEMLEEVGDIVEGQVQDLANVVDDVIEDLVEGILPPDEVSELDSSEISSSSSS